MSNRVRPRRAVTTRPRRRLALPPLRLPTGRPQRITLAVLGLGLLLVATTSWLLWPDREARQREYLDVTACLLTDENGVTGEQARPVWAAMQDASVSTLVKVQYLAVSGPQTTDNARTYAASLAGSQCGVVIAVGPTQVDAVVATAPNFARVRFVTIGGRATAANVSVIDDKPADKLRAAIAQQVAALTDAAP